MFRARAARLAKSARMLLPMSPAPSLGRVRSAPSSWRSALPEPGRWMDRLKRFLAIPMAASAAAALWLLFRQAGDRGLVIGAALSVGLLFAAFEAGRLQRRGKAGAWGSALAALALVAVGVA